MDWLGRSTPEKAVRLAALLAALLAGTAGSEPVLAAGKAASVIFAMGDVVAIEKAGSTRRLRRGSELYEGDKIVTRIGRAQLRFTDGGQISLIPGTEFAIEEYRFSGSADGTERGFFSLLKGGLRALTGLIGKRKRDSYRMSTPVATIGIRGTWFRAVLDEYGQLLVSVGYDPDDPTSVVITNQGGELVVGRGGNAKVLDDSTPPELTDQQVSLAPTQPPTSEEPVFAAGDDRDPDGSNSIVDSPAVTVLTNLIGVDAVGSQVIEPPDTFPDADHATFKDAALTIDDSGPIFGVGVDTGIEFPSDEGVEFVVSNSPEFLTGVAEAVQGVIDETTQAQLDLLAEKPAVTADFQQNVGLTWWRWTDGRVLSVDFDPVTGEGEVEIEEFTGNQSAHIVVGPPPVTMPSSGFATYTFAGGTASSTKSGLGPTGQGVVDGMLTAHFGPGVPYVSAALTVKHDNTYAVAGTVDMEGPFFSTALGASSVYATTPSSSSACFTSCPVKMSGFFSGDNSGGGAPPAAGASLIIYESDPILAGAAFRLDQDNSP